MRPDGLTQIQWQADKCMTWVVTVLSIVCLAYSFLLATSATAGAAAEGAADRKEL